MHNHLLNCYILAFAAFVGCCQQLMWEALGSQKAHYVISRKMNSFVLFLENRIWWIVTDLGDSFSQAAFHQVGE